MSAQDARGPMTTGSHQDTDNAQARPAQPDHRCRRPAGRQCRGRSPALGRQRRSSASARLSPRSMSVAVRPARARPTCSIHPAASIGSMRSVSRAARPMASSSTDGVMRWLRERGRGLAVGGVVVPIVPSAILFDLLNGGDKEWDWPPYRDLAYRATGAASRDFALGNAGARPGRQGGQSQGRPGQCVGGRSVDRPAGRRARRGEFARLHDDGRHAAVLGLGAGAGRRVRWPAAAQAWARALGVARSRRPHARSGGRRAQRSARQHHHRGGGDQRAARQGVGRATGDDGAGRPRPRDPSGAYAAGWRHRVRHRHRHA